MKAKNPILFLLFFLLITVACKKTASEENQVTEDKITLRSLGLAYLEENKLEEAENAFTKLTKVAPDEALGYANLGLVYIRLDKYDLALQNLNKAIQIDPKDADIRLIRSKALELSHQPDSAIAELIYVLEIAPDNAKAAYQLVDLYARDETESAQVKKQEYLKKVVELAPLNIVPRLQLIELLLKENNTDEALKHLEEIARQYPEFTPEASEFYNKAVSALHKKNAEEATSSLLIFHNLLKLTIPYQTGIKDLKGPGGALIGFPIISFSETTSFLAKEGESILNYIMFTDAAEGAGLKDLHANTPKHSFFSVGDIDGDEDVDLYLGTTYTDGSVAHYLYTNELGMYKETGQSMGIGTAPQGISSSLVDFDNDGHLDIIVLTTSGIKLYKNNAGTSFSDVTSSAFKQPANVKGSKQLWLDADHEGDLDLIVSGTKNTFFQNDGTGAINEMTDQIGFKGNQAEIAGMQLGDYDDDGDIDFLLAYSDGTLELYSNQRQFHFEEISSAVGLPRQKTIGAITVGDYNHDGYLDLIIAYQGGQPCAFYKNLSDGKFIVDKINGLEQTANINAHDIALLDFDNDGHLDLFVLGESTNPEMSGALLLHNQSKDNFEDVSYMLPEEFKGGRQVQIADYNEDGDEDLYIIDLDGHLKLFRNDGGNVNRHLKMKLVGLRTGSGKNNHFGIGAKVEVRAGDLYQMQVVTSTNVHFGMGYRDKADVVRITWTNGVPQNMFFPNSNQSLIEEQMLKGSCPFLYTWNGEKFVFVKDMMWRSALGMPLGIMGGKQAFAFADASVEYIKVPGDQLKAKDGKYTIQITEELWETIYSDLIKLMAVDHPQNIDIYVDEKFAGPPYPDLKIFTVKNKISPVSAKDANGNDLLSLIQTKDDEYISNFKRLKYQGVTEMKDLILDFGNIKNTEQLHLFMNGWIFPTDASINVALSQSNKIKMQAPSLSVLDQKGQWIEVIPNIGFPSGKNKTVIVNLSDVFLSDARKVKITTNMEIYWDYIFAAHNEAGEYSVNELQPSAADHHYRGFSATYRKEGRYGPHWFDYDKVSTERKWQDLTGNYTRYGDVTPLLQAADNMYIIANAGEETTIHFDAESLPALKPGWTRDFLIYSVGWVKDGDINTALGQTVEPLPYHGLSQYPYGPNDTYPNDQQLKAYHKKYNTRIVEPELDDLK